MTYLDHIEEKHPLILQLDDGIYQYLQKEPQTDEFEESIPFQMFVACVLKFQLRDRSHQVLRSHIAEINILPYRMRDSWKRRFMDATKHLEYEKQQTILKLIEVHLNERAERPSSRSTLIDSLDSPPPRPTRLNAHLPITDTVTHELRIQIDGACYRDLKHEAETVNMLSEEIALHLLHNYREDEFVRRQARLVIKASCELSRLSYGLVDLFETVLPILNGK